MSTRRIGRLLGGLGPALVLVIVGSWEALASWRDARTVPGDEDWEIAARLVKGGFQAGDLIVFAPDWVDPVGRMHLGDLMSIDMAARMDAAKYPRIWELSIRGARAPETRGLRLVEDHPSGGVSVRRYEQAPAVILADVRDRIATARVDGGAAKLELAEVGFAPHRCIEVVPPIGHVVRVTLSQLPLGTKLVGYVGLADVFTRRDIREPGSLDVELGAATVATVSAGVDDGWVRFEAATTPGLADVTFVIHATAPDRRICFAAETRQ